MTVGATIFHNPRCSKSRQALELLRGKGIEVHIQEYLQQPLSREQYQSLATALDVPLHDLLRTKESAYSDCRLSTDATDDDVLDALQKYPILLERPIVVTPKGAVIGRPPENVLKIL